MIDTPNYMPPDLKQTAKSLTNGLRNRQTKIWLHILLFSTLNYFSFVAVLFHYWLLIERVERSKNIIFGLVFSVSNYFCLVVELFHYLLSSKIKTRTIGSIIQRNPSFRIPDFVTQSPDKVWWYLDIKSTDLKAVRILSVR